MIKRLFIICIVLCNSIHILYAQNKTIKGRVIDNNLEPLPIASIVINDTVKAGKTDLNGFFQMDIPVSVKKISFKSVGYDPATISLTDKCDEVEVVMILSSTYDFISPGKVDKLRIKAFRKIQILHKQAFEKGIFKTDKACYNQVFISYIKKE